MPGLIGFLGLALGCVLLPALVLVCLRWVGQLRGQDEKLARFIELPVILLLPAEGIYLCGLATPLLLRWVAAGGILLGLIAVRNNWHRRSSGLRPVLAASATGLAAGAYAGAALLVALSALSSK